MAALQGTRTFLTVFKNRLKLLLIQKQQNPALITYRAILILYSNQYALLPPTSAFLPSSFEIKTAIFIQKFNWPDNFPSRTVHPDIITFLTIQLNAQLD